MTGANATFAVGIPLSTVNHTVTRLLVTTGLIGTLALVGSIVLAWFAVRRAFRPLSRIEDTAAAIATGDLTQRIPVRQADDEVTSLSKSLNVMLTRIESSFAVREASEERMRQFVADASHELRTPLATVRGYAELYRQGAVRDSAGVESAMERIEAESTRMSGLVEDLLTLARIDDAPVVELSPGRPDRARRGCRRRRPRARAGAPHLPAGAATARSHRPWCAAASRGCARS